MKLLRPNHLLYKGLNINPDKVNIEGGAIAIGHP